MNYLTWLTQIRCSLLALLLLVGQAAAQDKEKTLRGESVSSATRELFARPAAREGGGHRILVGEGDVQLPVVVVRGSPYEMGCQLGRLIGEQMRVFIPSAMAKIHHELKVEAETLQEVWARTAAYADDRVEQELARLADGSRMPLSLLQAVHAVPLLMPYSCSSIAAWGEATEDGHLYQTRNLDWSLAMKAHEFPVIVVYRPDHGLPHVVPTFAGMIGAHTGMNARGIALSEMGDASAKENRIPIKGGNVMNVVYDATSLRMWVSYAKGDQEAYERPYVFLDLHALDADRDGQPDLGSRSASSTRFE